MKPHLIAKQTLIQAITVSAVVLFTWLIVEQSNIFLVGFGGILIAILFSSSAGWLEKKTKVTQKVWLPLTILAPLCLLGIFLLYTAPKISTQANELIDRLPQALNYVQGQISEFSAFGKFSENLKQISNYEPKMSTVMNAVSSLLTSTISSFGNVIFAIILALFLVINPQWYINGSVSLVPPIHRNKARELLSDCKSALSGWLLAKIASMVLVGILTSIGLWILGIDLAFILGIIAALLCFIPNLGPLLAFIPAALVSVLTGLDTLLYVSILYLGIQTVESYIITPMLQAEIVSLPPALILFVQVLLASMVGMSGILLAAPLTLVTIVLVDRLYIKSFEKDQSKNLQSRD